MELADIIIDIRTEIGLDPFQVGDKILCRLYYTDDLQFEGNIYSAIVSLRTKLYLVNCPVAFGYHAQDLEVKAKNLKDLNHNLYYRWVEGNTLKLLI